MKPETFDHTSAPKLQIVYEFRNQTQHSTHRTAEKDFNIMLRFDTQW